MTKSLYVLIENQTKFVWEKKHQSSFNDLKQVLISSILAFSETEGEFMLDTDALNEGIGVVAITEARRYRKSDYIFQLNIK